MTSKMLKTAKRNEVEINAIERIKAFKKQAGRKYNKSLYIKRKKKRGKEEKENNRNDSFRKKEERKTILTVLDFSQEQYSR